MFQTVHARPMTFDDVAQLVETGSLKVYVPDFHQHALYVPATMKFVPSRAKTGPLEPVMRKTEGDGGLVVYGHKVRVNTENLFGTQTHSGRLHTTAEAEAAERDRLSEPEALRTATFIACDADDPAALVLNLMPVFGAQASASVIVAGLNPDELRERIERALRQEFGTDPAKVRIAKVQTRPVADQRADVYEMGGLAPIAVNVLTAEAAYYAGGGNFELRSPTCVAP